MAKETVAGTAVPATFQYVGDALPTFELERYMPEYPRGVRAPYTGGGTPLKQGTTFQQISEATYEELMAPLESGLAAGVLAGVSNAQGHTYTPVLTGNPAVNTLTAEWGESDGSATAFGYPGATGYPITAQVPYCFCTGFDFEWAFNTITKLTTRYRGRAATFGVTPTGSLAALTGRERISGSQVFLSIDTTFAAMGTTPLTGVVRSGKFSLTTGIEDDYTTDGRAQLDFTQLRWGMDVFATLQLVMEVDTTSAAEIKAWVAQNAGGGALSPNNASGGSVAQRFMRIQARSPNQTATRNVADGVTTISTATVTSATAAFTAGDLGAGITVGANLPSGTYIIAVNSATSVTVSAAATASGSALTLTLTDNRYVAFDGCWIYTKPPTFSQTNRAELLTMELKTDYDTVSAKTLVARLCNKVGAFS